MPGNAVVANKANLIHKNIKTRNAGVDPFAKILKGPFHIPEKIGDKDFTAENFEEYLASTKVSVSEEAFKLMKKHIALVMEHGTETEKACYLKQIFNNEDPEHPVKPESITDEQLQLLIHRLITNKPPAFYDADEKFLLRNNEARNNGYRNFLDLHKKSAQDVHFNLENYISSDELLLASLIGLSGKTYFVNNGAPNNRGVLPAIAEDIIEDGAYTASTQNLIDLQSMVLEPLGTDVVDLKYIASGNRADENLENYNAKEYNAEKSKIWQEFYGITNTETTPVLIDTKNAVGKKRFVKITASDRPEYKDKYLDTEAFAKILRLRLQEHFLQANELATQAKPAYIHLDAKAFLQGIELEGEVENQILFDAAHDVIKELKLPNIADIDFAFPAGRDVGKTIINFGGHNLNLFSDPIELKDKDDKKIAIYLTKNSPSTSTKNKKGSGGATQNIKADKTLVQVIVGESNAISGNKYWVDGAADAQDSSHNAALSAPMFAHASHQLLNPNLELTKFKLNVHDPRESKVDKVTKELNLAPIEVKLDSLTSDSNLGIVINQIDGKIYLSEIKTGGLFEGKNEPRVLHTAISKVGAEDTSGKNLDEVKQLIANAKTAGTLTLTFNPADSKKELFKLTNNIVEKFNSFGLKVLEHSVENDKNLTITCNNHENKTETKKGLNFQDLLRINLGVTALQNIDEQGDKKITIFTPGQYKQIIKRRTEIEAEKDKLLAELKKFVDPEITEISADFNAQETVDPLTNKDRKYAARFDVSEVSIKASIRNAFNLSTSIEPKKAANKTAVIISAEGNKKYFIKADGSVSELIKGKKAATNYFYFEGKIISKKNGEIFPKITEVLVNILEREKETIVTNSKNLQTEFSNKNSVKALQTASGAGSEIVEIALIRATEIGIDRKMRYFGNNIVAKITDIVSDGSLEKIVGKDKAKNYAKEGYIIEEINGEKISFSTNHNIDEDRAKLDKKIKDATEKTPVGNKMTIKLRSRTKEEIKSEALSAPAQTPERAEVKAQEVASQFLRPDITTATAPTITKESQDKKKKIEAAIEQSLVKVETDNWRPRPAFAYKGIGCKFELKSFDGVIALKILEVFAPEFERFGVSASKLNKVQAKNLQQQYITELVTDSGTESIDDMFKRFKQGFPEAEREGATFENPAFVKQITDHFRGQDRLVQFSVCSDLKDLSSKQSISCDVNQKTVFVANACRAAYPKDPDLQTAGGGKTGVRFDPEKHSVAALYNSGKVVEAAEDNKSPQTSPKPTGLKGLARAFGRGGK